jgi:DnaJ domain
MTDGFLNYYDLLGISANATLEEIRAAYRNRVKEVHPDQYCQHTQKAQWDRANTVLRFLNQCYGTLSDASRRAAYDQHVGIEPSPWSPQSATSSPEPVHQTSIDYAGLHFDRKCGWYHKLPPVLCERLRKRQAGDADQLKIATDGIGLAVICLLLIAGWFVWLWQKAAINELWSREDAVSYVGASFAFGMIASFCTVKCIRYYLGTLKGYIYITALYIIRTHNDKVEYWPLRNVREAKVTHYSSNGIYTHSELDLYIGASKKDIITISLRSRDKALRASLTLAEYQKQLHSAYARADHHYFIQHDDLQGVEFPDKTKPRRYWLQLFAGAILPVVLALYLSSALKQYNAWSHGQPPYINHEVSTSGMTRNAVKPSLLQTKQANSHGGTTHYRPNDKENPKPVKASLPVSVALPANGFTIRHGKAASVAPFKVITQAGAHYMIRLEDWDTGRKIMDIFVRDGKTIDITVPLGHYRMKYASGSVWYGPKLLFGPQTNYYQANQSLDFYRKGHAWMGHTVELIKQVNGNLDTNAIVPAKWERHHAVFQNAIHAGKLLLNGAG